MWIGITSSGVGLPIWGKENTKTTHKTQRIRWYDTFWGGGEGKNMQTESSCDACQNLSMESGISIGGISSSYQSARPPQSPQKEAFALSKF